MFNIYNIGSREIWEDSILASIAHAIMVAHYPELSHEHSWDSFNYSIQDCQGGRGTISFAEGCCFGALYCNESEPIEILDDCLAKIPKNLHSLALNEALQYMLQEVEGKAVPVVTTIFWCDNERLFSVDSREAFIKKGGHMLGEITMDLDLKIESWKEYYEMNNEQIQLLKALYKKKTENPNRKINLSRQDLAQIGKIEELDFEESMESFSELGMYFEDLKREEALSLIVKNDMIYLAKGKRKEIIMD